MKVLLATDNSEHAHAAAALLARMPHREHLELTVLFVSHPPEMHGTREVVEWMKRNAEADRERSEASFAKIREMFDGADATLHCVLMEGQTGRTIIEQAAENSVDLVVLGAKGHSTIDRVLLGSTSDFVATHAACSVLVVRPGPVGQHAPHICWAFDSSEPSYRCVDQLEQFSWGKATSVDILQILALPQAYIEIPVAIDTDEIRSEMQTGLKEAAERLTAIDCSTKTHVKESISVGEGIVRFLQDNGSDIVIMGDTGRGLLTRFLLGSISRYVLRESTCSVWIARGK